MLTSEPPAAPFRDHSLGDIQHVNNFTILHARTAYRDAPARQRHLVRLWIDGAGTRWRGTTARDLYVRDVAVTA